jgi:predicted dehydrogenase
MDKNMKPVLKIGIVGCGKVGYKRALTIQQHFPDCKITWFASNTVEHAKQFADNFGGSYLNHWEEMLKKDIDVVIVSTTNNMLFPISKAFLENDCHVLCEKPPGIIISEAINLLKTANIKNKKLKIGFNNRFHPAIYNGWEKVVAGQIGDILFIRGLYGHGGRPGMKNEWRGSVQKSGGGVLLDLGIHMVDLCRWYAGEFEEVFARMKNSFWGMEVEDNAWISLFGKVVVAQIQVSLTQWKNRFTFEVFGTEGYIIVNGLGGSYGEETLIIGKRMLESGPPEEKKFIFPSDNSSYHLEWKNFMEGILDNSLIYADGRDGACAMQLISSAYESAKIHTPVFVDSLDEL